MKISPTKNQQGFTLLELLIVVAISGIIMTGIINVFSRSQTSYTIQEEVAAMQQNVRTAKMFLERDIRMAGAGAMDLGGPNNTTIQPLWFENGHGASGSDRLTVIYENPDNDECGTLTAGATILCNQLPNLTLAATMPAASASAEVEEEFDDAPYSAWYTQTCSCNGTEYSPGGNMPFIVTTPDKSQSAVLLATQVNNNGGGSLDNFDNSPNVPYNQIPSPGSDDLYTFLDLPTGSQISNKSLNQMPAGSSISFFNTAKMYRAEYYVATDANGIMGLYRDTGSGGEVIAEHIEDFQCSFTLDDGSVINNRDLTAAEIADVRIVTISLIGRSAHQHRNQYGNFNGHKVALEDNGAGANDNYRRRLLTATIKVRNFGL